jgi:hypothetical protein
MSYTERISNAATNRVNRENFSSIKSIATGRQTLVTLINEQSRIIRELELLKTNHVVLKNELIQEKIHLEKVFRSKRAKQSQSRSLDLQVAKMLEEYKGSGYKKKKFTR